jgi:ketosteroid isomerase-like protein
MHTSATSLRSDPRTAAVVVFYESLSPASLAALGQVYSADAHFIDPFNDVHGLPAIGRVFEHMFSALDAPRFEVLTTITEGDQSFLLWNFSFSRPGKPQRLTVHGGSHLRFAADGKVAWHRDHWDPARELYEALPVLGTVLRWLRKKLSSAAA